MIEITTLGSSSKGNCYIISTTRQKIILECGVHYKKVMHSLEYDIDNLVGVLVSHDHGDHAKFVKEFANKGIDIYSSAGTFEALNLSGHRYNSLENLKTVTIGEFAVMPFDVEHDAAEPYGYLVYHPEVGKLLFITDSFYVKYKFSGINYLMIECNYSKEILDKNIKAGFIHETLRNRIIRSHFSLDNVKEFLKANDLSDLREIRLMHLSDANSDAKLFEREIEKLTGIPTYIL